ncbi:MAG TPA: Dethiobiotin synthetase [Thermosynechococcaceae cyanobacterium]
MDYSTAKSLILIQGGPIDRPHDALLSRLSQGKPPVPGQVTTILLALKVTFQALREAPEIDRPLASALHLLSTESRYLFDAGVQVGVDWPPLLNEDLNRIAAAVRSIFGDSWEA